MLIYFAVTLFVSAALLFLVQPMVGKMILPSLGGTPAVWNTCMVFFQMVLLVGYGYTHTLSNWPRSRQLLAQLVILALPFIVLPFSLGDWRPPEETNPVFSVLWLLLGMVGLPFFVVATSAPLLQKWFASTGHPAGKDPYFLYGASNLGSMLSLFLYLLAVEPLFALEEQTWLWTVCYGVLVLLVIGCMLMVWRIAPSAPLQLVNVPGEPAVAPSQAVDQKTAIKRGRRLGSPEAAPARASTPARTLDDVTWGRRLRWILLAAVPSSLMLGLTTHLTTDIAAIPVFWVVPLALYLLTFILVFSRWPVVWTDWPHFVVLYAQPFLLMGLVIVLVAKLSMLSTAMEFLLHILVFFLTTLMCHGELAKDRPSTRHLTEFYLWLSVGGVLGGLFNALIAPMYFKMGVVEYPLALVLACLLRPRMLTGTVLVPGDTTDRETTTLGQMLDFAYPVAIGAATAGLMYMMREDIISRRVEIFGKAFLALLVLAMSGRPLRFGLSLGVLMLVIALHEHRSDAYVFEDRSFFGFVRVRKDTTEVLVRKEWNPFKEDYNREYKEVHLHVLMHGGINHGSQHLDPNRRRETITYFHPSGGIGQLFEEWHDPRMPANIVGIGCGSPLGLLFPFWDPPYSKFDWPDARLPASLAGMAGSPMDALAGLLVNTQSEPPYAVVGLGTGALAAHAKPFQHMRFYEIDPVVKRLSLPLDENEEPIFSYVHDAKFIRGADIDVILGDGRLSLKQAPDSYYHILVLDAFSSDAIPVHLLTKEAVQLYLTKLAEGGVLVFNTTNRYVNINGVLADIAKDLDLDCYYQGDYGDDVVNRFGTDWIVMQRKNLGTRGAYNGGPPMAQRVALRKISGRTIWYEAEPLKRPVWTDRYSNLLSVLRLR